jgi:hypothetical protein
MMSFMNRAMIYFQFLVQLRTIKFFELKVRAMKNSIYKNFIFIVFGALSTMVWSFSAYAESDGTDKWHFQMAPYAWLAGQEGKVATLPPLPPADIDVHFYDDILGNINGALMLVGEARKGR